MEAAYLDACASVPSMIMDLLQRNASPYQHTFEIVDSSGNLLMEVPFAEVLDRGRKPKRPPVHDGFQKASVEMERTIRLIADLEAERAALRATLSETKRILDTARRAAGPAP